MSALRIHPKGEPVRFVDLGPVPWTPIHGTATLRGHAVVGESGDPATYHNARLASYQRTYRAKRAAREAQAS